MICLIIPPISDCFMPTLGVAQIAGYLNSNNIECKVYDAGAELLKQIFDWGYGHDQTIKEILGDGEYTYKNIASCFNLYSVTHNGVNLTMDNFETDFYWQDTEKLIGYVMGEDVFSKELSKLSFISNKPLKGEYYGISISYECQVVPALLLAKIIKKVNVTAKICIGGSLLYNYEHVFYKIMIESDLINYLIIGAGETALKYIANNNIEGLIEIPDIHVKKMYNGYIIDARELKWKPIVYEPDFSNIIFDYYPSKEKAFPYMIKDRCYYGKCYFCNGDKVENYCINKDIETAFLMMQKIANQIGVYNTYIVDAALSPIDMKKISQISETIQLKWIANARFEKNLVDEKLISQIYQKGCRMLRFGLESASPKVLKLMNKGTNIDNAEKILKITSLYGIKNHVYIMFGYPGETKEDRNLTIDFLKRNREYISSYSVSIFQPIPGTHVYQDLLKQIGEGHNVYERMIDLIYPDEELYNDIYNDISRIRDMLKGFAQTNTEYYSANIFNENTVQDNSIKMNNLLIEKRVLDKIQVDNSRFNKHVWVYQKDKNKKDIQDKYIMLNLYKKYMIHLEVTEEIVNIIRLGLEKKGRLLDAESAVYHEFIYLLDRYIEEKIDDHKKLIYFEVLVGERDISKEMSIQFSPRIEAWEEE